MPSQKNTESKPNEFLSFLKEYLLAHYQPAYLIQQADVHLSTQEIFEKLQSVYPSNTYTPEDVANWLHAAGFKFTDFGNMKFEWLLKMT